MARMGYKPVAGMHRNPLLAAIGRNDPCPCLSGIKFKRCCAPILAPVVDEVTLRAISAELGDRDYVLGAAGRSAC
jgi:hypothetical protein